MPKDEFDFEDPLELSGVLLATDEDTITPMCECFIEEFMRLGYNHEEIMRLFQNPYYHGMHMALRERGEMFVQRMIMEQFARWGKPVTFPSAGANSEAGRGAAPDKRNPEL